MNNAVPSSSTLYVQASPTIGIAVDAKKREQFPIGETASVLCNAILELNGNASYKTGEEAVNAYAKFGAPAKYYFMNTK